MANSGTLESDTLDSGALDRTFAACSHPIRRGILERLSGGGELSVGEATGDFGVSKPAISKHLKVLEEAGAIVRVIDGRTHRLRIRERALADADDWMARQRRLWERKLDVVEQYLHEQRATTRRKEPQ
jgi:DNA-binding transcriptional ArsR family regulator